ncbi:MAG TPA: hypothetical protein VHO69_04190 [Phototrophicaceae bacterium]|nr:hypothetical protein [Phototrophicaceae bacterium]
MPYPQKYQFPVLHPVTIKNGKDKYSLNTSQTLTEPLARWILRIKTGGGSGSVAQQDGREFTFHDGKLLL